MDSFLTRQQRRYRERTAVKEAEAAKRQPTRGQVADEHFVRLLLNMFFGVFGVGSLPWIFHAIASAAASSDAPHFQQDAYLLGLVLWGGTFYEARHRQHTRIAQRWLRTYRECVHWVSIFAMLAMAFGYAVVATAPDSSIAKPLENWPLVGVSLAVTAIGYLVFKVPVLRAEAEELAEKG